MQRPNVILISIDTLRADHVSCYGYHRKTTPNIDKIASEGTIFYRNYSTGVWTPPGHASMLTGLYVSEHGVYGENRLSKTIPTIAEKLKQHGYQTAGFVNNSQVGELVGFDKGHDTFVEVWKGVKPKSMVEWVMKGIARRIRKKTGYEDMGANKTNRMFKGWLENNIDKDSSFYAFLHYIEPHNPLDPPRPFKRRFSKHPLIDVDLKKINKVAYNPLICLLEDLQLTKEEISFLKSLYDGEIAYTDHKVGEVASMLKEKQCYDNTLIIITSDHGEHFGEHNLWSHTGSLYNEVLHIPLIIKFPKGVAHLKEVKHCTQLVDIFPTIMDITRVSQKEQINTSGVSLVCNGNKSNTFHDYIFAEWEGRIPYFIQEKLKFNNSSKDIDKITHKMKMISDGRYKYISISDGSEELYDLSIDSNENNNLINESNDAVSILKVKLDEWKSEAAAEMNEERSEIDEETRKNLERLGYM
jgi:arylsulfatase A-like enzyme